MNILVTGSNSGFGWDISLKLAKAGHIVFAGMRAIESRNAKAAVSLVEASSSMKGQVHPIELDVSTDVAVDDAIASLFERLDGPLDVIVNNAGLYIGGLTETISVAQAQNVMNVNFLGYLRVMRAVLPNMRAQGRGTIISISSDVAHFSMPTNGLYIATKAALEIIAETYAYELGPIGLESLIVQPGAFNTGITAKNPPASNPERMSGYGPTLEKAQAMGGKYKELVQGNFADGASLQVADAVSALLEKPYGKRDLRTVVDMSPAGDLARDMNYARALQQTAFMHALDSDFSIDISNLDQG